MAESDIFVLQPTSILAPVVKLREGRNVIGRDRSCSIVLSDSSVSRFHAEILVRGATMSVRDLESRNGTYVNGERVESAELRPGQQLQFGSVQLAIAQTASDLAPVDADLETQSVNVEMQPTDSGKVPLSAAERRVFDLMLSGLSEKEVAHRLDISPNTVHCHIRKIYEVLGVCSRAELMARFIRPPDGNASLPEKSRPTSPGR
jgi:DNA-binding CsgD family transcriptional regulator